MDSLIIIFDKNNTLTVRYKINLKYVFYYSYKYMLSVYVPHTILASAVINSTLVGL